MYADGQVTGDRRRCCRVGARKLDTLRWVPPPPRVLKATGAWPSLCMRCAARAQSDVLSRAELLYRAALEPPSDLTARMASLHNRTTRGLFPPSEAPQRRVCTQVEYFLPLSTSKMVTLTGTVAGRRPNTSQHGSLDMTDAARRSLCAMLCYRRGSMCARYFAGSLALTRSDGTHPIVRRDRA